MTFWAAAHFCQGDQAESGACHERHLTTGSSGRSVARPAAEPERVEPNFLSHGRRHATQNSPDGLAPRCRSWRERRYRVSTASLVLGVAAAGADTKGILVAGVAGLVAGAMSMAAGEYVSVSSQADTERADLARESKELAANPAQEHAELMAIYAKRGLDATLASSVATQLMQHDALAAHARDELGMSATLAARPVQAALASAGTFAVGAALPLLMVVFAFSFFTHVGSRRQLALLSCTVGPSGGARAVHR